MSKKTKRTRIAKGGVELKVVKIIPAGLQGLVVVFNTQGRANATQAAAHFGKRPVEWLRLPENKRYMEALEKGGISPPFVCTITGRNGGTWLHPKLAVAFARWLSPDFAVLCVLRIDSLPCGEWVAHRHESSAAYRALSDVVAASYQLSHQCAKVPFYAFINEARLVNGAISGAFKGRNRDQLNDELKVLALVEMHDVVLVAQGKSYAERKADLLAYAQSLGVKRLKGGAA
ncbi:KilA-N domain-containing protein [Pseudomonas sp. OV226]|uniref:KilA-N domain-containing protein n=1 Tax=Pseudomonas sp. OV226 TaxID=2135588 RepID=UPI000D6A93A0|nr:KilA-N domain-containing protein [Pseudomonas sp. OV226]PWK32565.1 KilA domain-containing protein [Pseudomonas sp. OV226]